ncbi:MAG: phosphoribosylformylglycinamidine cyclo-ligase [Defluviitaleaceae bacterium]|nr:phosphoribosylformylglycinamidine cyclo-ligase [Defluviitaleaceae bacterium]
MSENYAKAGVNLHAGYEAVSRIKKHIEKTKIPGVMGGFGGFGGLFDLSQHKYNEPVLVSGTDGVGTKLVLAFTMGKHSTIGIDAVAMSANDIVTMGAKPLFFLDYIACGKLNPDVMEDIVAGVAEGCVQAGCALIGGEMAEHPGMMPDDEYDIAGFCVGIVEKEKILTASEIKEGDVIIGLASSGVHSNGFSLIRKIISDKQLDLNKTYPGFTQSLGEILLTPTKMYVSSVGKLCENNLAKGIANITGGGFIENIPRILPPGLGAAIEKTWEVPLIFQFLQKHGELANEEMYNLYNMGVGMVVAVSPADTEKALQVLHSAGEEAFVIGKVTKGDGVVFS